MDNYQLYRARTLIENVPSQAYMRIDYGTCHVCSAVDCNFPANQMFNRETRTLDDSLCYDCSLKELEKIVGPDLISRFDDVVSDEVEAKDKTSSVIKEILIKAKGIGDAPSS